MEQKKRKTFKYSISPTVIDFNEVQPQLSNTFPNDVESIQEYKAELIDTMPKSPYTIDFNQQSV